MGVIPIVANRESWLWAPPPYFQVSSESLALSCSGGAAVRAGGLGLSLGSRRLSPHACGTSGRGRVRASPAPSVAHTRRRHLRAVRIPFLGAFAVRDGRFVVWAQRRRLIARSSPRALSRSRMRPVTESCPAPSRRRMRGAGWLAECGRPSWPKAVAAARARSGSIELVRPSRSPTRGAYRRVRRSKYEELARTDEERLDADARAAADGHVKKLLAAQLARLRAA